MCAVFFFSSFAVGKEENVGLILCRYDSTSSWEAVTVIKILSIRRYHPSHVCEQVSKCETEGGMSADRR